MGMKAYKFRVLIDAQDDVFRDIVVRGDNSFLEFHKSIVKSFGFEGDQMASFYMSNEEWDRGREIPLMDMGMGEEPADMASLMIASEIEEPDQRLVYVYDFMRMWCFYVELLEETKPDPKSKYPKVVLEYGDSPAEDSKEIADIKESTFASSESEISESNDLFQDIDLGGDWEAGPNDPSEGIDDGY